MSKKSSDPTIGGSASLKASGSDPSQVNETVVAGKPVAENQSNTVVAGKPVAKKQYDAGVTGNIPVTNHRLNKPSSLDIAEYVDSDEELMTNSSQNTMEVSVG